MSPVPFIRTRRAKILLICCSVVAALGVTWVIRSGVTIVHTYAPIRGRIVDADNDQPIPGVAVVAVYGVDHHTVGGDVSEAVDAQEMVTDDAGRFVLPPQRVFALHCMAAFAPQPEIHVFTPDHEAVTIYRQEAYSRIDAQRIPLADNPNNYRIKARPIVSIVTRSDGDEYWYRLSPLKTQKQKSDNLLYAGAFNGPAAKFPNYLRILNAELARHGQREWHGWEIR